MLCRTISWSFNHLIVSLQNIQEFTEAKSRLVIKRRLKLLWQFKKTKIQATSATSFLKDEWQKAVVRNRLFSSTKICFLSPSSTKGKITEKPPSADWDDVTQSSLGRSQGAFVAEDKKKSQKEWKSSRPSCRLQGIFLSDSRPQWGCLLCKISGMTVPGGTLS